MTKPITEVDRRDELAEFPQLVSVRAEVQALLAQLPASALPLRRKLRTVFAPAAIGLAGEAAAELRCRLCSRHHFQSARRGA